MSNNQEVTSQGKHAHKNTLVQLKETQSKSGYISEESIAEIAKSLDISVSEIYGVATFYSFLSTKPQGKNVIKICQSVLCHLKNSQMIIDSIEKELGIKPGETTSDGLITVETVMCLAACDKAPMFQLQESEGIHYHENMTVETTLELIEDIRRRAKDD